MPTLVKTFKKRGLGEDHRGVSMQRSKEPIRYLCFLGQVNGKATGISPSGVAGSRCSSVLGHVSQIDFLLWWLRSHACCPQEHFRTYAAVVATRESLVSPPSLIPGMGSAPSWSQGPIPEGQRMHVWQAVGQVIHTSGATEIREGQKFCPGGERGARHCHSL